ncbi:DUF4190 domain-containing protein [Streptomyces sp. NPDC047002]|uniref:DUF4190 domain-containing protein n=1 Tax=Streptomyces sp. NPDC047002 TaxID=3155475 RepID=UPI0034520308
MSDENGQQPDGGRPDDPWAPPGQRPSLDKPAAPPQGGSVHDQPTVAGQPGAVPPPPPAPGPYAYPTQPPAGSPAQGQGPYQGPPGYGEAPGFPAGPYGYPQYPGGSAPYPGAAWGTGQPMPSNGLGTAAMVLGIISVVGFCLYGVFGLVAGIVAIVLGIKGRRKADRGEANNRGAATAGLILGWIGTVIGALVVAFLVVAIVIGVRSDHHDDDPFSDGDPFATSLTITP